MLSLSCVCPFVNNGSGYVWSIIGFVTSRAFTDYDSNILSRVDNICKGLVSGIAKPFSVIILTPPWAHLSEIQEICVTKDIVTVILIHNCNGVSIHRKLDVFFKSLFLITTPIIKTLYYRRFVRRIHRWPVDSPHKGPVMLKAFPWNDVSWWQLFRPQWANRSQAVDFYIRPRTRTSLYTTAYRRYTYQQFSIPLQWRHNGRNSVSNHQPRDCLLNRLIKAHIKENIKAPRHWPLYGEFTGDRWIPRTKGQ